MKKIYLLLFTICLFTSNVFSQTFIDNFDTYTPGDYLAKTNNAWKTWGNTPGGADDIKISNAKAKSGSNSLYFNGGTKGGPVDIVLPFGGQYNTGTLNVSMWMFVDNAKKAYINLQEQTTVGKGWSVDVTFDSIGKFSLINTTAGTLLSGSYTQNTWMLVELQIDLNSNTWNFLIDGASKGIFQNTYRQIASLNIYPVINSSYYVDDVSYTYTPYTKPVLNASPTYIDKVSGQLAGQIIWPTVEIRNLGTQAITSVNAELVYDGLQQAEEFSGLNIPYLGTKIITFKNPITLASGKSLISAKINTVNGVADDILTDDIKILELYSPVPATGKIVIAEEATGTWCQWCPRGAVWLKKMDEKYNGLIVGIAVHNKDPMVFDTYDKGVGTKITGYPSLMVDRGIAKDPAAMESDFLTRILIAPKATIRNGAKYNSTTRALDVSLTTKFKQAVTGNYKIAFVLIEDSVTGTTSSYNQSNIYAGGSNGVMGGFETLPNPVPASKMVYDHVGRIISPSFLGQPNAFAPNVNAGDSFTHNFSVTLDPSWKIKKIHLVGMLIDPNGAIDNGSTIGMNEAIENGFTSGTFVLGVNSLTPASNEIKVYPNPSASNFNLIIPAHFAKTGELSIYNVHGQLVKTEKINGNENLELDAKTWTPGLYIGIINADGHSLKVKLVKE